MGKITSISEVRDLADLVELYANQDRNNDGLLGPGEASAEEIKAGDKEGPSADTIDGFLQPWEVMEMRGPTIFNPVETIRMRWSNKQSLDIHSFLRLPKDLEINGVTYQAEASLFFHKSRVTDGSLAKAQELPTIPGVTFPAGSQVRFEYNAQGVISGISIRISTDMVINGISCPKGTNIRYQNGDLRSLSHDEGVVYRNARYSSVIFEAGTLLAGTILGSARLPVNAHTSYLFQGRFEMKKGMVRWEATLAEDVPSPYGGAFVHRSGTKIEFFDDGTPFEGTLECFKYRYPHIALSGAVAQDDILILIRALEQMSPQMRSNIRGMHLQYENLFDDIDALGRINPHNKTIYLKKGDAKSPLTVPSILHEAGHMRHFALQDETTRRIAAATRHLDPSKPEDLAQDAAITQQILSRTFDARWSRIAGSSFSYSIFDVMAYQRNLKHFVESEKHLKTHPPKDGFVNGYGSVAIWEDIATCTAFAIADPMGYAALIRPESKFYALHPDQRPFVRVYRAKLELLREYGFITEAQYRKIVPVHPSLAAFCQGVNCR